MQLYNFVLNVAHYLRLYPNTFCIRIKKITDAHIEYLIRAHTKKEYDDEIERVALDCNTFIFLSFFFSCPASHFPPQLHTHVFNFKIILSQVYVGQNIRNAARVQRRRSIRNINREQKKKNNTTARQTVARNSFRRRLCVRRFK